MAHLHSVRLRGFKTFAKPTELTFEPGVTVIIGPNGSGKSNIADAVLWVLGEQSPGNLRGRSMQDVIFSGPGGRNSSAVAEVSLVFDNGDGTVPSDRSQWEVTRRLTRDTGSEYRLNGSGCRLLDVQDLVGGLGLGREMHSVISQGKVDALLSSTPEVRRAMVEEAAGLGRFKKRRERAQAKLERTKQNLLRVADIEREVKTALRPLRQQVVAAEKFVEATEEWALAKGRSVLHSLGEVRGSCAQTQDELERTQARRAEIDGKLSELRRQRTAEEEHFNTVLEQRERLSGVYHQARAGAEYLAGRAVTLRQRLVRMEGELDRARRRWELARSDAESLAARVEAVKAGTTDEARLHRVSGWAEALRAALDEELPAYRAAGEEEDDLKDAVFELEASRSRALQDRDFLRREVEQKGRVGSELAGLVDEAALRAEQLNSEGEGLRRDLQEAVKAVRAAEEELRRATSSREEARAQAEEASYAAVSLGETLAGIESRQAVLDDLLTRREGIPAGGRELIDSGEGLRPLTELLSVEPGYERAVAAALGPAIEAVVVPATYDLARVFRTEGALEVIQENGALSLPAPDPKPPTGTRDLWEVVAGSPAIIGTLRALIPSTAIVSDADRLDEETSGAGDGAWRLVSRSGELLQPRAHAARRRDVGAETVLKARNELEAVLMQRKALLEERDATREAADKAAATVVEAEAGFRRQEEQVRLAERRLAALRGESDLHARRLEEAQAQRAELHSRREREAGLVEQMAAELRTVEEAMVGKDSALEEARTALRTLQARLETMRRTVGMLEDKKGQAALVEVRLRERCRAQENERTRVSGQWESAGREVARCERRVDFLGRYIPVLASLLEVAERMGEVSWAVAQELQTKVEAARAQTEGTARVMRDWGGAEAALQQEQDGSSARVTELRVDQARLEDRRALLEEELADLRRRHASPRTLTPDDVAGEDADALSSAVERAERRRERIGPINPLAEQECAEMEERAGFLAEQRRDLEASLARLQEVIGELDEHIESAFSEIFEATREHFSAVMAAVFPGAKGTLKLTEAKPGARQTGVSQSETDDGTALDEDEEEREPAGGIALEVKLPNKSPRSLSLLSGGEKAMTAIAFLFSLFLARPCPFYILDEVEASLDDINIRRFLSLVRKYRDKTQFIIITHQRQTMEVADTLYGVTLEGDGTSRILSRRLAISKGA